jgi:hypothetical protein
MAKSLSRSLRTLTHPRLLALLVLAGVSLSGSAGAQLQFQSDDCPKGTTQTGKAPPDGVSQGCTTAAGQRHGPWTEFWPSGTKWRVGEFKNGKHHGHWTVFRPNGKKLYEADYKNGFLHGKIVVYYENEQKRIEGAYTFGKANGRWVAYTETGSEVGQLLFDAGNVRPGSKGNPKVAEYLPKRLEVHTLKTATEKAPVMQQVGKTLVSEGRAPAPSRLKGDKLQQYAKQSKLLVRSGQQLKLYASAIDVLAADAGSPVQVAFGEEAEVLVSALVKALADTKRSVGGFRSESGPSSLRQHTARTALKKLGD